MVMLSKLLGFQLVDEEGRRARLEDLAVAYLEGDYPPVTNLLFRDAQKQRRSVPWNEVRSIDWKAREFKVADLEQGRESPSAPLGEEAFLRRDILDALVIDLQNRRATRANDLCLEEEDGHLRLRSADTSVAAIWRRLSRGLFGRVSDKALYDWKYVEFLHGDPQAGKAGAGKHSRITRLPPGEIARLTDPITYLQAAELLILLPDPIAADTLEAMSPERQLQVFEELEEEQALRLLALMAPDVAADLVGRLSTAMARGLLNRLPRSKAARIVELLRYTEDSVGGIMTNDVVYLPIAMNVKEAQAALRDRIKEPDFVFLIYVVDDDESRRLRGLISLRNLLIAEEDKQLEEIMDPYVTTLHPLERADEASYRIVNSHVAAFPVVDEDGRLLGVVTVDAAVAQIAPQSWSSLAPRIFS